MKRIYMIGIASLVILGLMLIVVLIPKGKRTKIEKDFRKTPALKEASDALLEGRILEAKDLYGKAMDGTQDPNSLKKIQEKIEEINIRIIFSPLLDFCSTKYEVKPQDALEKIAKKFNTTVNLIRRANNLTSDIIRAGQELKVSTCVFSIVVDKSQNLLFLKRNGEVVKTYVVSTGKDNSTPIGTFKIVNKLENPTWYKAGAVIPPDSPDNILGSRWLGFDLKGYGIHGTTEPNNLGEQVTLGCVRMKNQEVEELFDIVPLGTEVIIID